jgi:hypothetical protein
MLTARIVGSWDLPGVGAGSGLVRVGDRLAAVQDDAPALAWIDPETREVACVALEGAGTRLPKPEKPDLEAIAVGPDGTLWLLGSGSTPRRRRICRVGDDVSWLDAGPLFDALAEAIGEPPNVEGAVVHGGELRLFHRGAGRGTCRNWLIDVALGPDGPCLPIAAAREVDLGRCGDVPWSWTDAARLPDGRIMYLAAAEDTPDAVADGPVVGAAIGILDGPWAPLLEPDGSPSVRKCEGLAVEGEFAWVITDPDDAARPAQLLRVALEGPWREG